MYTPAAFGGGSVQVFMLNYCLGINTGLKIYILLNHNNLLTGAIYAKSG